jgi:MFS family permease
VTTLTVALALVTAVVAAVRGTWSPCGLSMVSAINPMSERARGNRYWLTCLWFVIGATAGGLVLGLAGAVLATAFSPAVAAAPHPVAVALAVAALVCLAADAGLGGFRLPLIPRQLNESWLADYRRWLYACGFGLQLGLGFATYVMTAGTYLLVVLMAATGSAARAVSVGVVFGAVRGAAVTLSAGARNPDRLRHVHQRLDRMATASMAAAMTVEVAVAVLLAGSVSGLPAALATLAMATVMIVTATARTA